MDTDRNLRFAVLAHRQGLINRDQFVRACTQWAERRHLSLAELLVEEGWLTPTDRTDLERQLIAQAAVTPAGPATVAGQEVQRVLAVLHESTIDNPSTESPGGAYPETAVAPTGHPVAPPIAIAGRNQLVGEIGRGGMGAVHKGRDPDLDRDVAVKVLLEEHRGELELVRRFLDEARINGQLQHPGVVPVYELGQISDGRPFFTMKLVKGRTLADFLASRAAPTAELPRFLGIFEQVCQTVAYAHARRVIHRDLKPSNIMVGSFGEVQVMDWGLAKVLGCGEDKVEEKTPPTQEATVIRVARMRAAGEQTQAGSMLGTPAYMAPEQARGEIERIDERADVFGLGAILCAILTGQPPYVGPDVLHVRAKALDGAVEECFARLDNCGADAELVQLCKDCLAPRPEDRPRDASVVALCVADYEASVRERLQQAELERAAAQVKAAEERKRRRLTLALATTGLGLVLVAAGSGLWVQRQQAQRQAERQAEAARQEEELRQAVASALEKAAGLQQQGRWAAARAVLDQARERLGDTGPEPLVVQIEQARRDLDLVDQLEAIRLRKATVVEGLLDYRSADRDYAAVFRAAGLGEGGDAAEVAALIRRSAIREQLIAALDDWAEVRGDTKRRAWVLEVARRADPDVWRDRFRDPEVWQDRATLERLARELLENEDLLTRQSPQLLAALAGALKETKADVLPLLAAARARYPNDFWLNFELGYGLVEAKRPEEAIGYYRVALAVRPGIAVVHNNLGVALRDRGQLDEAIREFRAAIALDPKYAVPRNGLAVALREKGQLDEAIREYRAAIALDPKDATPHNNLGNALRSKRQLEEAIREYRAAIALDSKYASPHDGLGSALKAKGQLEEAIREYRTAITLDPKFAWPHHNLGVIWWEKGQLDEAIREFRAALTLNPKLALARNGLGVALLESGQLDEAIRELRSAIALDPKYVVAHNSLGNALYDKRLLDEAIQEYRAAITLDPKYAAPHNGLGNVLKAQGQLDEAIREYRTAIALDPKFAWPHHNLGSLLVDQGLLDEAITHCRQAIALNPSFANPHYLLGKALLKKGRFSEAQDATRRCLELVSEGRPLRRTAIEQLRQCERLIALAEKLPALLKGEARPADANESLSMAQLCQDYKGLHAAAARFYTAAFEAQPALANDLNHPYRYNAACAAARAGCGQGQDAAGLTDGERARLREQARDWLRADLRAWTKRATAGMAKDRELVRKTLKHWQADTDLAGLRDPDGLARLPEAERAACRQLWDEVAALLQKVPGEK